MSRKSKQQAADEALEAGESTGGEEPVVSQPVVPKKKKAPVFANTMAGYSEKVKHDWKQANTPKEK